MRQTSKTREGQEQRRRDAHTAVVNGPISSGLNQHV